MTGNAIDLDPFFGPERPEDRYAPFWCGTAAVAAADREPVEFSPGVFFPWWPASDSPYLLALWLDMAPEDED